MNENTSTTVQTSVLVHVRVGGSSSAYLTKVCRYISPYLTWGEAAKFHISNQGWRCRSRRQNEKF